MLFPGFPRDWGDFVRSCCFRNDVTTEAQIVQRSCVVEQLHGSDGRLDGKGQQLPG